MSVHLAEMFRRDGCGAEVFCGDDRHLGCSFNMRVFAFSCFARMSFLSALQLGSANLSHRLLQRDRSGVFDGSV